MQELNSLLHYLLLKALTIPLLVGLVVRRHMSLHRTVLIGVVIVAQIGSNASPSKKVLCGSPGEAGIYLLHDVGILHGIVHPLHTNVVIILDRSNFQTANSNSTTVRAVAKTAFPRHGRMTGYPPILGMSYG